MISWTCRSAILFAGVIAAGVLVVWPAGLSAQPIPLNQLNAGNTALNQALNRSGGSMTLGPGQSVSFPTSSPSRPGSGSPSSSSNWNSSGSNWSAPGSGYSPYRNMGFGSGTGSRFFTYNSISGSGMVNGPLPIVTQFGGGYGSFGGSFGGFGNQASGTQLLPPGVAVNLAFNTMVGMPMQQGSTGYGNVSPFGRTGPGAYNSYPGVGGYPNYGGYPTYGTYGAAGVPAWPGKFGNGANGL